MEKEPIINFYLLVFLIGIVLFLWSQVPKVLGFFNRLKSQIPTNPKEVVQCLSRQTNQTKSIITTYLLKKHIFVVGGTDFGKTTFMRFLTQLIIEYVSGVKFIVIDPHHSINEKESFAEDAYGRKRNWDEIEEVAHTILEELDSRADKFSEGLDVGPTVYICVDELPAVSSNTKNFSKMVHTVSCEGRKFKMFLVLNTQSLLVNATGFKNASDFYMNFLVIRVHKPKATITYVDELGDEQTVTIPFEKVDKRITSDLLI